MGKGLGVLPEDEHVSNKLELMGKVMIGDRCLGGVGRPQRVPAKCTSIKKHKMRTYPQKRDLTGNLSGNLRFR